MTRVAPAKVRQEAKLGLMLHKKWKRGGTAVGVARAVQLSSGKAVSDAVIKRMYSYFQRHQHDRLDKDGSDGSIPGRGYIAWLLWGGNSGRKWAESEYKKLKGKKKNPIGKPVKKIKEDLAKKEIYLIKVTLDDYRSESWAQDMVTKEEDFEVVDNYDDYDEPIFKMSEFVYAVLPKKYLQDFNFVRKMQTEGKIEKLKFPAACRAWLENDQPLDWFNEQAHDRGYLTKDEYLFLVKVNNPTEEENTKARKEYFIELAKECGERPRRDTKEGWQLDSFLRNDPAFKKKMKELCPQWFRDELSKPREETPQLMNKVREMVRRGDKRPSQSSKDPDEKKLGRAIAQLFIAYKDFRDEIFQIDPRWSREGQKNIIETRKEYFIELAKKCEKRPEWATKDGQQLGSFLRTDPTFKKKIKELCPHWFRDDLSKPKEETLELMEKIREMARRGDKRPPQTLKIGKTIANLFANYPIFRNEILSINRNWFTSEERKQFAEYKEENPITSHEDILNKIKENEEVLKLKNFIENIESKKQNPSRRFARTDLQDNAPEHWITARLIEIAILTSLKAADEDGLPLQLLSEAAVYILKRSHDKKYVKVFVMITLRQIEEWRRRKLDLVAKSEPAPSSPLYVMKRRPSSVYRIKSKGIAYLEKAKKEVNDILIMAESIHNFDSLIDAFAKRVTDEEIEGIEETEETKKENPLQLIARGYDERPASAYDREELKLGLKTELEHTDDAIIASKIAKDHLDEDPKYYSKLVEMERGMKKSNPPKNIGKEADQRILYALRFATIDYVILSALHGKHLIGLPPYMLLEEVLKIIPHENPKSFNISIHERLQFYISNSYVFKKSVTEEYFRENFPDASKRVVTTIYCIDLKGIKLLEKLNELFDSLGTSITELQKQKNPSKDEHMTPEEYLPILEEYKSNKKANPVTPESEEYLPIVQDSIEDSADGLEAWIDEASGDILVGWMAFDENRLFDDVMVRIKAKGQIVEGDSVDDSIRKSAQDLMKKIHKDLAEYVTKKPNPSRFQKLVKKLEAKGAEDPKALAAWIGRQKYGEKKFQQMAEKGKKKIQAKRK